MCPEPNDDYQRACNLGASADAYGFISAPDDRDTYRLLAVDFRVGVRAWLVERPHPYRLMLMHASGATIAMSDGKGAATSIDTELSLPGAYFLVVDSPTGASTDGEPYRLMVQTDPQVAGLSMIVDDEFRAEGRNRRGRTRQGMWSTENGLLRFQINGGSRQAPSGSWTMFGENLTDFVISLDTRFDSVSDAVAVYRFRERDLIDHVDQFTLYLTADGRVALAKFIGGEATWLIQGRRVPSFLPMGVNQIVIQATGARIQIHVNQELLIDLQEPAIPDGNVELGAITWGDPIGVEFDNLLIIAPADAPPLAERPHPSAFCPAPDVCPVTVGKAVEGVIANGKQHIWHFRIDSPTEPLAVRLFDLPADYDLLVRKVNGPLNSSSLQGGTVEERVVVERPSVGDYVIHVMPKRAASSAQPYRLVVEPASER